MYFLSSKHSFATVIIIVAFNSCGGSGTDGSASFNTPQVSIPSTTVLQGVFVDSAVAGLAYTTATQSGMTDSEGHFSYVSGETIVFSIGDIKFPALEGRNVISPLEVFNASTVEDVRVSNLARLLQTLDEDGIPGNGISIVSQAHNQATGVTVDFSSSNLNPK